MITSHLFDYLFISVSICKTNYYRIVLFTPSGCNVSRKINESVLSSVGAACFTMLFITSHPDGALWFFHNFLLSFRLYEAISPSLPDISMAQQIITALKNY
jgi:hypothetical protein